MENIMKMGYAVEVTFKDGNTQAVMAVYKFKDGKIFSLETGATNMPK